MALTIKTNKYCYFCDNNLSVGAAIPLFSVTKNKEFTGKSCFTADSIVLAELLKIVGIIGHRCKYKFKSSSSLQKVCKENCQLFNSFSRPRDNCGKSRPRAIRSL